MAALSSISITLDASKALQDATRAMIRREVAVGIPGGGSRQPEPGEKSAPPDNSLLGYIAEFGDDARHIPARPFLLPGLDAAKDDIVKRLTKTGQDALAGVAGAVDKGLMTVGLVGQNAVRDQITNGTFAPLAERTLAARQSRGRTGTKPLIDSGQMRASVTFVVRDKGSA